jgi:hypothetical protein
VAACADIEPNPSQPKDKATTQVEKGGKGRRGVRLMYGLSRATSRKSVGNATIPALRPAAGFVEDPAPDLAIKPNVEPNAKLRKLRKFCP